MKSILFCFLIALLLAVDSGTAPAQTPTVASIRELYGKSVASIETIDAQFAKKYIGLTSGSDGKRSTASSNFHRYRYVSDGEKFFLQETLPNGEKPPSMSWNGKRFFSISDQSTSKDPRKKDVQFRAEIPQGYYMNHQPANILGMQMPITTLPLTHHLADDKVKPTETPWEFDLGLQETIYDDHLAIKVTFDPEHDFLPSCISFTDPSRPEFVRDWQVLQFKKFSDEKGTPRWLPAKYRIFQGKDYPQIEFKLIACKLNQEIPASQFDASGMKASFMNVDTGKWHPSRPDTSPMRKKVVEEHSILSK